MISIAMLLLFQAGIADKPAPQLAIPRIPTQHECMEQGWPDACDMAYPDIFAGTREREMARAKLADALVTRVLTEAEMNQVLKLGEFILMEPGKLYSEKDIHREYAEDLTIQSEIRKLHPKPVVAPPVQHSDKHKKPIVFNLCPVPAPVGMLPQQYANCIPPPPVQHKTPPELAQATDPNGVTWYAGGSFLCMGNACNAPTSEDIEAPRSRQRDFAECGEMIDLRKGQSNYAEGERVYFCPEGEYKFTPAPQADKPGCYTAPDGVNEPKRRMRP